MSSFTFTIPSNREELLNSISEDYVVQNVCSPREIVAKLQEARVYLRDDGVNFILDTFDIYYSVLHHSKSLQVDVIHRAYKDLQKGVCELNNTLTFLLEDKDSLNDEIKTKMLNVLKMILFLYVQFVIHFENQQIIKQRNDLLAKGRAKAKKDDAFSINKSEVLILLNSILQHNVSIFWDPPVVSESYVTMMAEVCYAFLHNPAVKYEKELRIHIFGVFGNLIKSYNYGSTFVIRLIQAIKMYEHVYSYVPEGIKLLVDLFGCNQVVHHLIREATEWQADENSADAQGSRFCSLFMSELAILMPEHIIPEITYMNQYLSYDSAPLRISILNMMTEVIYNVLTKHDLTEMEKELRDDLLTLLLEHTKDVTALVRSKVIHNLIKLQKDNAIPLTYQARVLREVLPHLRDKGNIVRKAAMNCVTTFVTHNLYGASLQLNKVEEELAKKKNLVNQIESTYKEAQMAKLEEIEQEWTGICYQLKETIEQELEKEDEDDEDERAQEDPPLPGEQLVELIRLYLKGKKFAEAFKLCRTLTENATEWKKMLKNSDGDEVDAYLTIMRSIFSNMVTLLDELRTGVGMSEEDVKKLESLKTSLAYFEGTAEFLKLIDEAMGPMKELLFSKTVTDMHEAINFFVMASKFQIDNVSDGILEMLQLMKYNEQDRKDAVVQAFKMIYLETEATHMTEHTTTIVNRLIDFLEVIPVENYEDLQDIVAKWAAQGIIDNSVIDMCWHYFTKKVEVSDSRSRGALEILRMAAIGRKTIITKNIKLVGTIAFSERGACDMLFLGSACRFLAVAGRDKIDINSKDPAFRISHDDSMFENLSNIIVEKFFEPVPFYKEALEGAINFIYKMCSKPAAVCENIFKRVYEKLTRNETDFIIIRFCNMLGFVAVKQLGFLDDVVYRELKRRTTVSEARRKEEKITKEKKNGARVRASRNVTIREEDVSQLNDVSVLEGAQAEDTDAEFIMRVLENDVITNSTFLGQCCPMLVKICSNPNIYDNVYVQGVAVTALMRYMLVSECFCEAHIRLLFVIFEKTKYSEVKCSILLHCSDLLTRFPNVVEPWTPKIYDMLRDGDVQVRKTAFFTLSNLILRDMIRMHSHISEIAVCLIDENEEVSGMCRMFFAQLAQKESNLANVIPDIFSHLVKIESMTDENLKCIMKFLFEYVDSNKRMENLVDRFCSKFSLTEDVQQHRQILYCLSLITYNDKALRKLYENFPNYKHLVHDGEIYGTFKQIFADCSKVKAGKTDLKPIVTEIENAIQSVFEINENGQPRVPPPALKPTRRNCNKTPAAKSKKKKSKQNNVSDENDDNSDDNNHQNSRPKTPSAKRTRRARKPSRKATTESSDSE